jgi:1,2-diacylglycerol 3-alpha-glucosyltransferase
MNIAILVPIRGHFGVAGFYNRQELGLGKALARMGHRITVVRCAEKNERITHTLDGGIQLEEFRRSSLKIGDHGIASYSFLQDTGLDAAIVFGDIQVSIPYIDHWCRTNGVVMWPYIGTLESNRHSDNPLNRWVLERNLKVYRRRHCLAKTPDAEQDLRQAGGEHTSVLRVGLDVEGLTPRTSVDRKSARQQLGFEDDDKVVGFVGRFDDYKRPLRALRIFSFVLAKSPSAKMLAVGSGPLLPKFLELAKWMGLDDKIRHVSRFSQREMATAYSACDVLVNLNEREIFGMSIMESLYYGVPVVAIRAPGPESILCDEADGVLVDPGSLEAFAEATLRVLGRNASSPASAVRVEDRFSWQAAIQASGFPWERL